MYFKKSYLIVSVIILFLALSGYIVLPFINKKECTSYIDKTMYFKTPFANIPINIKVCEN